jgi:hypothetical protein
MKLPSRISRNQLALPLTSEIREQPSTPAPMHEELVKALADLLLEALGAEVSSPAKNQGGSNEPKDNA